MFTFTPEHLAGGGYSKDPYPLMRYFGKASAHGIKGGLFSFVQGGKFEQGFFSGMASSASAPLSNGQGMGARVAFGAVVGGTVEEIGGGKFANGAVTGSFTVLFNHVMHEWYPTRELAANSAIDKVNNTGNEVSVLVYEDTDGNDKYWECPQNPNLPQPERHASWIEPPDSRNLKLIEEFHYSIGEKTETASGIVYVQRFKGSYEDWRNARDFNITITHNSIGVGSWIFKPTYGHFQPIFLGKQEYYQWNNLHPIKFK